MSKHKDIDVNLQNGDGNTALMLTMDNGYIKIVEILLQITNIDVNLKNSDGNTAIMIASNRGYIEIVEIMSKHKDIDVNLQNIIENVISMNEKRIKLYKYTEMYFDIISAK